MALSQYPDHERCHGIAGIYSKNEGERCISKVFGKAREEGLELCYAHWQKTLLPGDPRIKLVPGPGRPRIERPSEALQRMVDERVEEVIQVFFDAIEAEDVTVAKGENGEVEIIATPNHLTRMKAADSLLDRAYGKAIQRSESKNVNIGIEARSEKELEALADAMRASRELEPAEEEDAFPEDVVEGTAHDVSDAA